jgi:xylose isomerase
MNIEANHATLAGHSFEHEIALAQALGVFGSIDANRGDPQNGWDTDQFPNSVEEMTLAMLEILRGGGFSSGGLNFDAKVRRQSLAPADLFYGHVSAIDVLARATIAAAAIIEDGRLEALRTRRYAGWQGEFGQAIAHRDLAGIAEFAAERRIDPVPVSGEQERLENLVNRFT